MAVGVVVELAEAGGPAAGAADATAVLPQTIFVAVAGPKVTRRVVRVRTGNGLSGNAGGGEVARRSSEHTKHAPLVESAG